MRTGLVLLLFVGLNGCQGYSPYVPGERGADWTLEETLIVKAKLMTSMDLDGSWSNMWQVYQGGTEVHGYTNNEMPNEAKFVRLGFHDCLKYADGSGGCDGCLNWEGMGARVEGDADGGSMEGTFSLPDVKFTNNNGMKATVELLEAIYTKADFPPAVAPYLSVSLKDSGKSRADLWALAALVAVEYSIDTNNMVCNGNMSMIGNPDPHQCHHNVVMGIPGCEVEMKPLKFQTGRRDCAGPEVDTTLTYKTTKHEHHPSAVGGSKETTDFFREVFDFTGREMVAIMGAHTLGHFHYSMSLFKYVWTSMGDHLFNNHYYKNVVTEDRVAFNEKTCHPLLTSNGSVPKTRWVNHVHGNTINGGPVHWIHENHRCPNCVDYKKKYARLAPKNASRTPFDEFKGWLAAEADEYEECCTDLEPGQECNPKCERWRFLIGRDEMAIPAEMSLYYQFDVDGTSGLPHGCPGYKDFTIDKIKNGLHAVVPKCQLNSMSYPEGTNDPIHAVFEEYAADQSKWVDDFIPTYEKMLSNGYNSGDLTDGPDVNRESAKVQCSPRVQGGGFVGDYNSIHGTDLKQEAGTYYNCWVNDFPQDLSAYDQFTLENMWLPFNHPDDIPMVLASDKFGHAIITMPDPEDLNQKWVLLDDGIILNVGNRMPLSAGGGRTWKLNSQIGGSDGFLEMTTQPGWVIGCQIHNIGTDENKYWYPKDGDRCSVTNNNIADPRNKFMVKGLPDGYPADLSTYDQFTLENMWIPISHPDDTPMVLESNKAGYIFITKPEEENLNQKWVQLEDGVILNVGNRLPLTADAVGQDTETVKTWELNGKIGGLDGYIKMTTRSGWAVGCQIYFKDFRKNNKDREWYPRDGDRCFVTNESITDPRNRFKANGLSDGYPEDLSKFNQFTLENMWLPLNRPQYAAMVLESDNLGVVFITKPDQENPKQKWVQLEDNIILNVGTRLPLSVFNNEAKAWILNSEVDGLDGYIEMATSPGMAIKCQINYIKEIEDWSPRDGDKCYVEKIGRDSRHRFFVKMLESNDETTEMREETTTEAVVETTTQVSLSAVPCADKRNKKWCNRNRCTNHWWYPKTQCIKSCSETEGAMDFCEGNETLPCKDFDENEDCEAVKRDGKCDDATERNGKMKEIWNLRCFKTCGNC